MVKGRKRRRKKSKKGKIVVKTIKILTETKAIRRK